MIKAVDTKNEKERLKELESYGIMGTNVEEDFDNLTKLASEIIGTRISLVSLIDDKRQWFKSRHGLDVSETPKELAFCAHAIHNPKDVFIIPDARKDERFYDNPLVTGDPNVIFYAGVPLVTANGFPLGTLCVIDNQPKELTEQQIESLRILSKQVMNLIELRKRNQELSKKNELLEKKNEETEQFAYVAAHDLKSPLNNIKSLIDLLLDGESIDDSEFITMMNMVRESSDKLAHLIEELLAFAKVDKVSVHSIQDISPQILVDELKSIVLPTADCSINLITNLKNIEVNITGTMMVLQNLVTNAIKYSDKTSTTVDINILESERFYKFHVKDNGPGISSNFKDKIFKPFETLNSEDRYGNSGTGFGLSIVKKVLDKMGGDIFFESEIGNGTTFTFTIKKSKYSSEQLELLKR